MTEREYRAHPAISRSDLWLIRESPEKFKYYTEHPPEPTPAQVFGQAFHKLALQPESFYEEFAVFPGTDKRTKAFRDFKELNADKTVILEQSYTEAYRLSEALHHHPEPEIGRMIGRLLSGEREKVYFWTDEDTGIACKCRADCVTDKPEYVIVTDLKSALHADTENFTKATIRYGYDFQAAMYSEGVRKNTGKRVVFVFLVIEKEPPYAVNIFQADEIFVRRGYDIYRELMGIYRDCRTTGDWYGYTGKYKIINNLSLPAWLAKEIE